MVVPITLLFISNMQDLETQKVVLILELNITGIFLSPLEEEFSLCVFVSTLSLHTVSFRSQMDIFVINPYLPNGFTIFTQYFTHIYTNLPYLHWSIFTIYKFRVICIQRCFLKAMPRDDAKSFNFIKHSAAVKQHSCCPIQRRSHRGNQDLNVISLN